MVVRMSGDSRGYIILQENEVKKETSVCTIMFVFYHQTMRGSAGYYPKIILEVNYDA